MQNHLVAVRPPQPAESSAELGPRKRAAIVTCATEAFLTHGFAAANLENIAIAAGVGKATIYRYFPDKEHLFAECVLNAARLATAPAGIVLPIDQPIEAVLADFAERHMRRMLQPVFGRHPFYELARMVLATPLTHPELARSCSEVFRHDLSVPLTAYFQAMLDAGRLAGDDAAFLATHFLQTVFFTTAIVLQPGLAAELAAPAEQARRKVRLFLHGCLAAAAG
jgi:AcrR family transcriptional regulator